MALQKWLSLYVNFVTQRTGFYYTPVYLKNGSPSNIFSGYYKNARPAILSALPFFCGDP